MKFDAKKVFLNPYSISFLLAIFIVIALYIGTFSWLESYTNHNEELVVPDLSDLTPKEAAPILAEKSLKYEVVDSVFMKGKKLGAIVEQIPEAGAKVKAGRAIYLITNSNTIRKISLPDVREISLRQAEAMINSVGLKVDSVQYVPSEYKDLVKDVKYGGTIVIPGARIPEGGRVTLLVGCGDQNELITVPSFRSLSHTQALSKAHSAYLNIGEMYFDKAPKDDKDKDSYFVYKQTPVTGSTVKFGATISIYLTKDPTALEVPEETATASASNQDEGKNTEEDLFN